MINNSIWSYAFIRTCIFFLHNIAPLSAFYCTVVLVLRPSAFRIPLLVEIWALAETFFFLLVYWPRNHLLQRAAVHPELPPRETRRELFQLCSDSVEDPERYLCGWFRGASSADIKRDNVKGKRSITHCFLLSLIKLELLCWAFLNKDNHSPEDEEELDEYADKTELMLGRKLEPGRGKAISLRVTVDRVQTSYRSCTFQRPAGLPCSEFESMLTPF